MRELARDGNRDRKVVLVRRRLPAFEPAGEEGQELLDRPPAPDHRRGLPEGWHHPVRPAQREDAADLRGFLALDRREGADPALALEPHHPLVQPPAEQHGAVHLLQDVGRDLRLEGGVEVRVAVQDGQVLDRERRLERFSGHAQRCF